MNRFKSFIFLTGALAVIGGMFSFPAEAALVELQLNEILLPAPLSYEATGQVRADLTDDIFTFSSAGFPDSPASNVRLAPAVFAWRTHLATHVDTLYESETCWPTGFMSRACGGVVVESVYKIYHVDSAYSLSLDGNIDTVNNTATLTPVPETAPLNLIVEADSRTVLTGSFADAPAIIKTPILAAANLAADQFGSGNIFSSSQVTAFEPTLITADVTKSSAELQLDIYWSDLMIHYAAPSLDFNGSLAFNSVDFLMDAFSGADNFFSGFIGAALGSDGSCGLNVTNCLAFSEINRASFSYLLPNDPPVSAVVPEPASAALLGLGLAGYAFARRPRA